MTGPDFAIPLGQMINVVALSQALIFAIILAARQFRDAGATLFLVAALLIIATMKMDQLYQMLGGLEQYPQYGFLLSPFQALMTPVLFLYVCAKTTPGFKLKAADLAHAIPFLMMFLYLFAIYYRLTTAEKAELIASGGFEAPIHRFIVPIIGDIIQLAYVVAAYRRLQSYGMSLRDWFSRVENRDLRWLKRFMLIWGAIFLFHAVWTISAGALGARQFAAQVLGGLNFIHLAMINAMMLMGVTQAMRAPSNRQTPSAEEKYSGSSLSAEQRAALCASAVSLCEKEELYLEPDLTLDDLAHRLAATPREVSEAINGVGGQSFFEFVNRMRVAHARRLLSETKQRRILEIAFESGFNSKTAFNEAFRRYSGQTPSAFRKAANSDPSITSRRK